MRAEPHQGALRKGRVSIQGHWYAVTVCVEGRRPLLVTDPAQPAETGAGAREVLASLRWLHDRGRALCHGYCVMPDHLHAVLELGPGGELGRVMNGLKTFTARAVNRAHGREGRLWQRGYFDHALRGDESWEAVARYVIENPVRKGYVSVPEAWPWSGLGPPRDGPFGPDRPQERAPPVGGTWRV